MNELSNQMRQERFYITDSVSRVNTTLDMYADKVELMEAVIFEHNELIEAARYQIKRAIAQLDGPFTRRIHKLSIVDSVKAQLEAYLKGGQ